MSSGPKVAIRRMGVAAAAAALVAVSVLSGCTGGSTPNQPSGSAVAAPSGGSVTETVTPVATPEAIETDLQAPATPAEGLTVRLAKIEAIEAKAQGPGEVSGPAVAITIELDNGGSEGFDTSLLSVNLEDSKGLPGAGMIASPAAWINGTVEPGGKVQGVYVFSVPKANRDPLKVSVSVNPGLPTVLFTGKA